MMPLLSNRNPLMEVVNNRPSVRDIRFSRRNLKAPCPIRTAVTDMVSSEGDEEDEIIAEQLDGLAPLDEEEPEEAGDEEEQDEEEEEDEEEEQQQLPGPGKVKSKHRGKNYPKPFIATETGMAAFPFYKIQMNGTWQSFITWLLWKSRLGRRPNRQQLVGTRLQLTSRQTMQLLAT